MENTKEEDIETASKDYADVNKLDSLFGFTNETGELIISLEASEADKDMKSLEDNMRSLVVKKKGIIGLQGLREISERSDQLCFHSMNATLLKRGSTSHGQPGGKCVIPHCIGARCAM